MQQFLTFQPAFFVVVVGEECGDDQVAGEADGVQAIVGAGQLLLFEQEGDVIAGFDDLLPGARGCLDAFLNLVLAEDAARRGQPMEVGDLPACQADQRIAGPQGMVQEREGMVPGQGSEPKRQFRQVHGQRVLVDAVEAALGDQAAGVQGFIFVRRNPGHLVVHVPGFDQHVAELPANFHKEGARAHGGITDLQVENLL